MVHLPPCARCMRTGGAVAADANAVCQINHAASGCSPGGFLLHIKAHCHHVYASSSRMVDMGNWCGCIIPRHPIYSRSSDMQRSI